MSKTKTADPFKENPEEELKRRMEYAKPLTRDQFLKRLKEIKSKGENK